MKNETFSASTGSDIFETWCASFNAAMVKDDGTALGALFVQDGYWRDMLTLDDRIQNAQGPAAIGKMLSGRGWADVPLQLEAFGEARTENIPGVGEVVGKFIRYRTAAALGHGYLRLKPDTQHAFTLLTAIREWIDHPEKSLKNRDCASHRLGPQADQNWLDKRLKEQAYEDRDPEVLIIGAGHAGLTVAARLQHLGVDALIVDRYARVGDNWRSRYHSLTLHNEICCNHLPYMPFPDSWPLFLPKDKLAGWLEYYVEAMELNVWNSTSFLGASYDEKTGVWTARVQRQDGTIRTLRPSHVVLAIGVSGIPDIPAIAGQERFRGQIVHSSAFNSSIDVKGKSVVVVGAGTSAHDIAQDVCMRGGAPVMVQRSSVTVVSMEQSALAYGAFSRFEGQQSIEDTDLMVANPFDLVRRVHGPLSRKMAEGDAELLGKLEKTGFLLDNGKDDTGFFMKLVRSLSGYYINVGASDLIIEGKIGLRPGVSLQSLNEDTAELSDGEKLNADILVLGTGYRPLQDAVSSMFGPDVAEKVGPIWGLDDKNEMQGMWDRTGQPGFFVAGGTFTMSRFYSRLTALLIKKDLINKAQVKDCELIAAE